MGRRARQFFEFGQFRLDVERTRLIRDGEMVSLPPKAIALLLILLNHAGRAVEKEEIIETLWPDTVVEDSNLTQTVHLLRKAISKYQDSEVFIETLPRFGYRLIADNVREFMSEGEELARRPTLDPVEPAQPSLAISENPEPEKTLTAAARASSEEIRLTPDLAEEILRSTPSPECENQTSIFSAIKMRALSLLQRPAFLNGD